LFVCLPVTFLSILNITTLVHTTLGPINFFFNVYHGCLDNGNTYKKTRKNDARDINLTKFNKME
jgi:hypothetical protein